MGTVISLRVSDITIDWSKNSLGLDHGILFQKEDHFVQPEYEDEIEGSALSQENKLMRTVLRRPLSSLTDRLDLLGFSLETVRMEYETFIKTELGSWLETAPESSKPFTFDELVEFINRHNIRDLSNENILNSKILVTESDFLDIFSENEKEEERNRDILNGLIKTPCFEMSQIEISSIREVFIDSLMFLHPYSILRLLCNNPSNSNEYIEWDYGLIVDSGWVKIQEINTSAKREDTFLIATEGTSDSAILKKALKILKPYIADFFSFIDVENGHPFPGTGGLYKFAEGLVKIDIQNRIIFMLDNDSEGVDAFQKIVKMKTPKNMKCMLLPDLCDFENFPTEGPNGTHLMNINKKAVAIECFLDLDYKNSKSPFIRWTNFKKETSTYQGSLQDKEYYAKKFIKTPIEKLEIDNYDTRKLKLLLEHIITESNKISGEIRIEAIKRHMAN
ncbi:HEPN/Toprim-associated domain-containing protein [Serratia marcescens]|uniref:HEPN/Toprim-associated domain-containing protein n=1 Tax=Serratia marcescens TaxID=615 RepID=UPI001560A75D|nr:hypothetical protein [Serratia marcescens]NRN37792.1 hypothetical protein [Serratia marcescens]